MKIPVAKVALLATFYGRLFKVCPEGQISLQKEHEMFAGSKLCFLLHETLFAAQNSLPTRGGKPTPKSWVSIVRQAVKAKGIGF